MRRDIDDALRGWPYDPDFDEVAAREVRARDGRPVVQIRIDLGMLQMELDDRPDGDRPRGCATYLDYLRGRVRRHRRRRSAAGPFDEERAPWLMSVAHCAEADRELVQFYHRRIALLSIQQYDRALRDAEHSLALMDFIVDHCPDPDFVARHERLRGGVLFDRTQASVARALERCRPDEAIDAVHEGIDLLRRHDEELREFGLADDEGGEPEFGPDDDDDGAEPAPDGELIERLIRLEAEIRSHFEVRKTLREQLDEAVEREDYERAARLRDEIRAGGG